MPKINQAGLTLIKSFEGCRLTEYTDAVGVATIGYGHTGPDVTPGLVISQAEADTLLEMDLSKFEAEVNADMTHNITPNQFAALVSFCYNVGAGAFQNSTLLARVNAGDIPGAAAEFRRWVYGNPGQVLPGLVRRREAERALFLTPG